ncbi:MAG TPA: KamA family protein [Verrucomicrobiales bacterium]|nr:KamA family protein [Verrucomicrobiales bacterium]
MSDSKTVSLKRRHDNVFFSIKNLDKIAISVKGYKLLEQLLQENPKLEKIMRGANNEIEALKEVKDWVMGFLENSPNALKFYTRKYKGRETFESLKWEDYATIRLLDYIDNAGREFDDSNLRGEVAISNPIKMIWLATKFGIGGAKPYFFEDMIHLFRQFSGKLERKLPDKHQVKGWMSRWPSGLDSRVIQLREKNKRRILDVIINRIDKGEIYSRYFKFEQNMTEKEKYSKALKWWDTSQFHLNFAIRSPDLLNEMLGFSLDPDTLENLKCAEKAGIPFFINPYYLSLINVRVPSFAMGSDLAIRDYIIYSKQLVNEFGNIIAWEKEDQVEPGKPNIAGWILPTHNNIHRRYPEVAILIPDTVGRACGGLCQSCQRMYDFQSGHLNFDLEKLKPKESWPDKLKRLMDYFENDSQLRDILITGGDALMGSDKSIEEILEAIFQMASRKIEANQSRKDGEKFAELVRVRLGTRLPVYIPQRITKNLVRILSEFKSKASKIGVKQFIVQTHFESAMEVTPEASNGIKKLISSGWIVTNQHVMTASSSRRGHIAKLRQVLNEIGILCYYTFSVKGYMENQHNFATNARAVQEQMEEKKFGEIPEKLFLKISDFLLEAEKIVENIKVLLKSVDLPFLSTDRNILNLPGVGKSLSFRVIGVTRYGRRILEFDHDKTRIHSPIIKKMGRIIIIESKSISEYLEHLEEMGEDLSEYKSIWGYSIGETEPLMPIYEYPDYPFKITSKMTNLKIA